MDNTADYCIRNAAPPMRAGVARRISLAVVFFAAIQICAAVAQGNALADLSLEQLAALPVITVSKTAKPVSVAPASVFVIRELDIRRAGSTSLPEALRLAPNLQVARVDARNYAVSARGFNNALSNKLQVLIDGRTIYSPFFSGVYWDVQDVVLEDLDRIEVVSGPGGSLWGANAVNGVINIVTRSAAKTQGELLSIGGSEQEQHTLARYGGSISGGHYRVYAKHSQHDNISDDDGSLSGGWERTQAGFRTDWGDGSERFTFQGDVYNGRLQQVDTEDARISGANLLARGGWELSSDSRLTLQSYIDYTYRDHPAAIEQRLDTLDIELQHEWKVQENQKIVWGGGYRYLRDHVETMGQFVILPEELNMSWRDFFVQDEIELSDRLRLTLGVKMEDNPYTRWETMPSMQLAWNLDSERLLWTSLSRAVRSPSRTDRDFYSPRDPPVINGIPFYQIAGGPDFVSEVANVIELGYRSQPKKTFSWSVTTFYSEYDKLRTFEFDSESFSFEFKNMAEATTYGVEVWGSWQATDRWRLHAGLTVEKLEAKLKPGSNDLSNVAAMNETDPQLYGQLRSSYDISSRVTLDATLRHVDEIQVMEIPAYTALDLRVAWKLGSRLELSLIGQNLLDNEHTEFEQASGDRSIYERSIFGKLVWGL